MTTGNPWKTIIPLCVTLFINALTYGIIVPVIGPLLLTPGTGILPADLSLFTRNILFSLVFGLPMFFMFLGAPLIGDLSDQFGRKRALLMALVGIAASCLLSAYGVLINSILLLLIGRCILGFMDSSESIAKAAIIDISKNKNYKIINMSLISIAGTAGFILGPLLGGWLANFKFGSLISYQTPFIFAAALALLNALSLFFSFTETYIAKRQHKLTLTKGFQSLYLAFADPRIRNLSITFFNLQFIWGMYFQIISILLVEVHHYPPDKIGLFMTYFALCFVFTLSVIIRLFLNLMSTHSIILLSLFLVMCSGLMIAVSTNATVLWLSVPPMSIGIGMSYNTLLTLFSEIVELNSQGKVMGIASALFASSWLVASLVGGLLSSFDLRLPYVLIGILSAITMPILWQTRAQMNAPKIKLVT